jgi:hypothetical protein
MIQSVPLMAIAIERLDGAVRGRGKAAGYAHEPFVFNGLSGPNVRWTWPRTALVADPIAPARKR